MIADKGVGTGGDGGDVSPPIFETGAFVPPKNYTAKYLFFFKIFYSLAFILKAQHSVLSPAPCMAARRVGGGWKL